VRIVRLTLACPPGRIASKADAELICDALWAHSGPGDEIAHITTTALPDGIDVAIFLNSDAGDPERRAEALLSSVSKLLGTHEPPKTQEA
jgi:hypothetical protein